MYEGTYENVQVLGVWIKIFTHTYTYIITK